MTEIRPSRRYGVIVAWKIKAPGLDNWLSEGVSMKHSLKEAVYCAIGHNEKSKKLLQKRERAAQPRRTSDRLLCALLKKKV